MTRSETCLKAAVRAAIGLAIVVLGQAGGSIAASLVPISVLGPLVYLVALGPTLVVGLYLVSTAVWVIVEDATDRALERRVTSPVHAAPDERSPAGDAGTAVNANATDDDPSDDD